MTDPITHFLEELQQRRHIPLFEEVRGSVLLDLTDGERTDSWFVAIDRGDVRVSPGPQPADCVLHTDRLTFSRLATGEMDPLAALLRGSIYIEGNLYIALLLGRLLPGPPHSRWRGRGRERAPDRRP